MIEIYRNSAERLVSLKVPLTPVGAVDVSIYADGEFLYEVNTINAITGGYSFNLPFFLAQYDRDLDIEWKFEYIEDSVTYQYENMTPVRVITPILSIEEVQQISPDLDEEAAKIVESQVRHIITSITNQSFGYYVGKKIILGNGERSIRLPDKLIDFSGIETNEYVYNPYAYTIKSDGWYLAQNTASLLSIKEMPPESSLDNGPVITTPYAAYYSGFKRNLRYIVDGRWGYLAVPPDVKLAARLMVEDYACPEVVYRDKFLESIKSGDWRLQFNSQHWENTGNVRANMLLAPYVLFDWALI